MHYAVYCIDRPDSHEMRCDHRAAHRAYLDSHLDKIFFSGPLLADDGVRQLGTLFILSVESRAQAEAFLAHEPYYGAGIFSAVTILRMRKGRFRPENLCEEREAPLRFELPSGAEKVARAAMSSTNWSEDSPPGAVEGRPPTNGDAKAFDPENAGKA